VEARIAHANSQRKEVANENEWMERGYSCRALSGTMLVRSASRRHCVVLPEPGGPQITTCAIPNGV